jgi:hypothetical protein
MLTDPFCVSSGDALDGTAVAAPEAQRLNGSPPPVAGLGHDSGGPAPTETAEPEAAVQRASWSLCSDACSVPEARHRVCAQLSDWGLDGQSDVIELLISEPVDPTRCGTRREGRR